MKKLALILYIQVVIAVPAGAQNLDLKLLDKFNNPNTRGDLFNERLSQSAAPATVAVPATLFIIGLLTDRQELRILSYRSAIATASTAVVTLSTKFITDRERPYEAYPEMFIQEADIFTSSFPSGHTSFAFSTSINLAMAFPKWYVAAPSFAWAAGVGYSRMHLGVHYPTDVLAGAAIGALTSWLLWNLTKGLMH